VERILEIYSAASTAKCNLIGKMCLFAFYLYKPRDDCILTVRSVENNSKAIAANFNFIVLFKLLNKTIAMKGTIR